jgi:hypothetical protein
LDVEAGVLVILLQEHVKGRAGLRARADRVRLTALLQEQEKLPGRQGLRAGAERLLGW